LKPDQVKIGEIYRLARMDIGGYRYSIDYDNREFIHVRVLEGPLTFNFFKVTTRGEDGEHLGPGGGWSDDGIQHFFPSELEVIPK